MKTITITIYKFHELSEQAKQQAIERLADINVNFDWWCFTYDDAKNIGLKITGFELDRRRTADGELIGSLMDSVDKIKSNHGKSCDTYKLADSYEAKWNDLVSEYSDGITLDKVAEDKEYDFDDAANDLEKEFLKDLLEEYSLMLQRESEYLQSDEGIIDAIQANDYDFTEDGKIY